MPNPVDPEPPAPDAPVELTARVVADGSRFIAAVDGLELEGVGNTPAAAEDALVQVIRGWLERQDTAGKLGDAVGRDDLEETAEIVLKFVSAAEVDDRDG